MFIFFEPLVLSIALDGEGSFLLEFGELDGVGNSIKGEIEFPVMGSLPRNKPYTHVMYDDTITVCAFCHANERVAFEVDGAPVHISVALRPTDRERIMIDELWMEHMTCDSGLEPRRCAILKAIFKNDDDVFEGYFPDDLPTFY